MSLTSALAIYFILWWLAFLAILPFGVRTVEEEGGEVQAGHAPSAPSRPLLMRKVVAATFIAFVILLVLRFLVVEAGLTLDDVPFLPDFARRPAGSAPQ